MQRSPGLAVGLGFELGPALGLALLLLLSPVSLRAAQSSQTFYLSTDVRAGEVRLPRGICEVSWSAALRTPAQLRFRTDDGRTITAFARMIQGRQPRTGVVTSVVNGVTYLDELYTSNARFIFRKRTEGPR